VTRKTRADRDFHNSYQMLLEEEAAMGRGELFAKSEPSATALGSFDKLVADLNHYLDTGSLPVQPDNGAQEIADRAMKPSPRFSKACRDLDQMVKGIPVTAKRVAGIEITAPAPTRRELMAKATNALMHDATLSAHDRGMLLLGVSAAQGFAKAEQHPVAAQVEKIKAALEQARDTRDLSGPAATYLAEALRHIEQGITDEDDRVRLMGLLNQLKLALAAGDEGAL